MTRTASRPATVRDLTQAILDAVDELSTEGNGDILVFLSGEREIRDTAEALTRHQQGALFPYEILPLVRPAVLRRPAQGVPDRRQSADRARDQRGGDLSYCAGHPLRDRHRARPHLALQPPAQGAAAADRGGLAGVGQPAQGPLRPGRRRHLHPALLRGGLPRPAGVHRAGDPAHLAGVGDPVDGLARPRRHRDLPVRRAAGPAQHPRRRRAAPRAGRARARPARRPPPAHPARQAAGPAAGRPAAGPHGDRGRQERRGPRGRRHRGSAVDPGPARAPGRQAAGGRREAQAVRRQGLRLHLLPQPVELPAGAARRRCPATPSAGCARRSTCTTCGYASGRTSTGSCAGSPSSSTSTLDDDKELSAGRRQLVTASLLAGLLSHIGVQEGSKRDYAGARGSRFCLWPGSASVPASRRAGSSPPSWSRPRGCGAGSPRASSRSGSSRSPSTWSGATTPSRTGSASGRPSSPSRRSRCTGSRSWCRARSSTGQVDPELSRELFIRHALVEGDWTTHHKFFAENRALLEEVGELEERTRRRDIVVGDEELLRLLRRADPGRGRVRPALRLLVEGHPAHDARPAVLRAVDAGVGGRRRRHRPRTSRRPGSRAT